MKPTVSVIIPFYNRVDWLEEAVCSVLNQTYKVHEIIIINDGSKENMIEFMKKYDDKIKCILKQNGGPATARNTGIELSTGDYIAFLDSDDIWLPKKLEKQIPPMVEQGAMWSHTSYETFVDGCENDKTKIVRKSMKSFDGDIYPEMLFSCPIATPSVVIKGDVLRNNTQFRFNNSMRYGQDYYLWLNMAARYKILAIDEILTKVRIRGTNASLRSIVQIKVRAIIWKYMNQNRDIYFNKKIPATVKFAFRLSIIGTKILNMCEKVIKNALCLEYISRILYIVPWLIFKYNSKR